MGWAGTHEPIYHTVSGVLSKELPSETRDIFPLSLATEAMPLFIIWEEWWIFQSHLWQSQEVMPKKLSPKVFEVERLSQRKSFFPTGKSEKKKDNDLNNILLSSSMSSEEQYKITVHFQSFDTTSLNLNFFWELLQEKEINLRTPISVECTI